MRFLCRAQSFSKCTENTYVLLGHDRTASVCLPLLETTLVGHRYEVGPLPSWKSDRHLFWTPHPPQLEAVQWSRLCVCREREMGSSGFMILRWRLWNQCSPDIYWLWFAKKAMMIPILFCLGGLELDHLMKTWFLEQAWHRDFRRFRLSKNFPDDCPKQQPNTWRVWRRHCCRDGWITVHESLMVNHNV